MELEKEKKSVNGLGIASLVFGIVGILTICGCGIGFFFGLIGAILGILGLTVLKNSGKGFPIAGLIVSGIALVFGSVWIFLYIPKHKTKNTTEYATTSTSNTSSSYDKPSSSSSSSYSSDDYDVDASWSSVKDSWNDLKQEIGNDIKDEIRNEIKNEITGNGSGSSSSSSSSSGSSSGSSSTTVTPELKEFCDSYEAFMDQSIKLLESTDQSSPEFMKEYAEYINKLAEFEEKATYYSNRESEMSAADLAYYTACMARITEKMTKFSITY